MASTLRNIFLISILLAMPFVLASAAFAANESTTYARVFVINSAPVISDIILPDGAYDPETTLPIQVEVTDTNGVPDDITSVNATLTPPTEAVINLNLTYNATSGFYEGSYALPEGAEPGSWNITVNVKDAFGATGTDSKLFTINTIVSLNLANNPIDFGNTSIPVEDRRADNGTAGDGYEGGTIKGYPLTITNDGNVAEDFSIKGDTLVGQTNPVYTLAVGSIEYSLTEEQGTVLTGAATEFAAGVAKQASEDLYFWITISENVPEQEYKGNVTVSAVQA